MTRSTQAQPTWAEPCARCRQPVLASTWDYPLGPLADMTRHVDAVALNQTGMVAAIVLARDLFRIHTDRTGRVHISHTYGEPRDDLAGRNPRTFQRWVIPKGHVDLGTAPRHVCETRLPGTPITIPGRIVDDHGCTGDPNCLACTPPF